LLITVLTCCQPHFVRCIKPNGKQQPDIIDEELMYAQLRYSGLLETVKIRRCGFPSRKTFGDFVKR
jgi:myosin heavy subunit